MKNDKAQLIVNSIIGKICKNADPQHLSITCDMISTAEVYSALDVCTDGTVYDADGGKLTDISGYDLRLQFTIDEKTLINSFGGMIGLVRARCGKFKLS